MVKKFEFQKNSLTLDIAGHTFDIELTAEVIAASDRIKEQAAQTASELSHSGGSNEEAIKKACVFLADGINGILGEGTAETIFEGRKVNILDLSDVLNFILTSIYEKISEETAKRYGKTAKRSGGRKAKK